VQLNYFSLPQLQPGRNRITVKGKLAEGTALKVTYLWDDPSGKGRENVTLIEDLPYSYEIIAAGKQWEDCVCKSITVEVVEASGGGNRTEVKEAPSDIHQLPPMRPAAETRTRYGWWQREDPHKLPSVEQLIADLDDPERQENAIKGLMELRDPRAFDAVKKLAYECRRTTVKGCALVTLYNTDAGRAKPILLDILEHPERSLWTESPIYRGPRSPGQHWAHTAVIIGIMAREAGWQEFVPGLVKVLESPHATTGVRLSIMRVFGKLADHRAAEAVRRCLDDRDLNVRAYAALAAGRVGDRAFIPRLRELLGSRYVVIRARSAVALGMLGDRESAPRLREMLHYVDDENVRAAAAQALGEMEDRGSAAALEAALEVEPFPWVREKITQSLSELR